MNAFPPHSRKAEHPFMSKRGTKCATRWKKHSGAKLGPSERGQKGQSSRMKALTVMCLDDDAGMRGHYGALLGPNGHEVMLRGMAATHATCLRPWKKRWRPSFWTMRWLEGTVWSSRPGASNHTSHAAGHHGPDGFGLAMAPMVSGSRPEPAVCRCRHGQARSITSGFGSTVTPTGRSDESLPCHCVARFGEQRSIARDHGAKCRLIGFQEDRC
jgi:hypothetical protein